MVSPMADVFTPEKRREVMSRIGSRDTKPELIVRSMLHRLGYRFTVNGPKNQQLPGRPDIVLPRAKGVSFFKEGVFRWRLETARINIHPCLPEETGLATSCSSS